MKNRMTEFSIYQFYDQFYQLIHHRGIEHTFPCSISLHRKESQHRNTKTYISNMFDSQVAMWDGYFWLLSWFIFKNWHWFMNKTCQVMKTSQKHFKVTIFDHFLFIQPISFIEFVILKGKQTRNAKKGWKRTFFRSILIEFYDGQTERHLPTWHDNDHRPTPWWINQRSTTHHNTTQQDRRGHEESTIQFGPKRTRHDTTNLTTDTTLLKQDRRGGQQTTKTLQLGWV